MASAATLTCYSEAGRVAGAYMRLLEQSSDDTKEAFKDAVLSLASALNAFIAEREVNDAFMRRLSWRMGWIIAQIDTSPSPAIAKRINKRTDEILYLIKY